MALVGAIVAGVAAAVTAVRRDLHAHPELGWEEFRTSDIDAVRLQ